VAFVRAWHWLAPVILGTCCADLSAQAPAGKVLPLEGKVLDIVGVALGLDAQLKELGAKVVGSEIVIELAADVLFDFDKHAIKPAALPSLTKVAAVLKELAKSPASVEGHTDGKGDDAYNLKLSERRAGAVKDWLVKDGGIAANRLSAKGFGKSKPFAPNARPDGSDDPEGRQKNRRVEIRVKRT
jgi:outer membrane protein OmpA-like peptidoglycan-associated protein